MKLEGKLSERIQVSSGVRQGCVIAPFLFNIFMDFIIRKALDALPSDIGIQWQWRSSFLEHDRAGGGAVDFPFLLLLYADDLALLSSDPAKLKLMLERMDETALKFGFRINASKTKVMSIGRTIPNGSDDSHPLAGIVLSGGPVEVVHQFRYLGSIICQDGSIEAEIGARAKKALGAFQQMNGV